MRTVIEDPAVSETIDSEQAAYPRLEDAFDALKWWLAHVPERGVILDDQNWICRQEARESLKIPALVAIYTFDHKCVRIKYLLVRMPSVT